MNFLIDHNFTGQARILYGSIASQGWLDVIPIRLVLREENTPNSLPVITISNADRVLNDPIYRERCVDRIIEIAIYTTHYLGARRIFIP